MKTAKLLLKTSVHSIFWGWNLIFIAVVYVGLLPFIGIPLIEATFNGDVSFDFCLTFITLITVPIACTFIGAKYLRTQPKRLISWFYGVEAPLFAWCLVRLFLVRELTAASTMILVTLLLCIFAYGAEILRGYQQKEPLAWLQIIAHTLILLIGVYGGVVLLLYAIPAAFAFGAWIIDSIIWLFTFEWVERFWRDLTTGGFLFWSFWGAIYLVLIGFTATLFLGMPFAVTTLYVKSGRRVFQAFSQQYSQKKAVTVLVSVVSLWLIVLSALNQQPQIKAFKLLDQFPQEPQARQELLAKSDILRQGLVNANLYPYRYLSTRADNNHIFSMYDHLGLPQSASLWLQHRYNQLLAPFLYQGSRQDVQKAENLYAQFFDTPLQRAERQSVRHALQSTSIVDQAKAGLLNIDQKKVWLEKQEVTLDPHGDWADVEIYEVYKNQTNDVEEIFYYFSLPESAAITGLWLGESDQLDERFPFQVSPRGAAQEVYNSQVQRRRPIDPALLEQVGSGQYRLRAFPVPRRLTARAIKNGDRQTRMHLWLNYKVMKQDQGWALPKLAEKRNIYWTRNTKRIRNGERKWFFADAWLEDFVSGTQADKAQLNEVQTYQIKLKNDYAVTVKSLGQQDYMLPRNQKYALILDTSYSMNAHLAEIKATFDWWNQNLTGNKADLYLSDFATSQTKRLNNITNFDSSEISKISFFGALSTPKLLQQFQKLQSGKQYDAVVVLTDRGSYELAKDQQDLPQLEAPLWMVHLGGELPRAYEDKVLQAIQNSNGGIAKDLATVMKRLGTETSGSVVMDGYSWTIDNVAQSNNTQSKNIQSKNIQSKNSELGNAKSSKGMEPLAARQLVSVLSRQSQNQLSLEDLDTVHQIAQEHDLVTPYSSMIVLVNDAQRELLQKAEARSDRFEREVETGVEQLTQPFNPFEVSGVPEPDVWILLTIVAIALLLIFQREKVSKILN